MNELNIIKDSTELRKLIAENPNLPIVVMVGEEAAASGWCWTYCTDVKCRVGEVLDKECPWESERIYNDKIEFEEDLGDYLSDLADSVAELDEMIEQEIEKYKPYWHKAIIITADN